MLSIDSFDFDRSDLELQEDGAEKRVWHTRCGGIVELHFFQRPPDVPAGLNDSAALLRAYQRIMAAHGTAVVEATVVQCDGCPAVRLIVKACLDADTGRGRVYAGSYTIPRRDVSFLLKMESSELGTTGVREAFVTNELLAAGKLRLKDEFRNLKSESGEPAVLGPDSWEGWLLDPLDPAPPHLSRNVSDNPKYDAVFVAHPLTRVRSFLSHAGHSIRLDAEFKKMRAFNVNEMQKPWWKVW